MKKADMEKAVKDLEKEIEAVRTQTYVLRLYIAGVNPRSVRAISNIKEICETHLKGRYELEVIDLYQQPVLAKGEQILAAPTLIKKLPEPLRKFIGDMSDTEKILVGLDLRPKEGNKREKPESKGSEDRSGSRSK